MNDRRRSRPRDRSAVPAETEPGTVEEPLEWYEWIQQVSDDEIVPRDMAEAVAFAFTKACAQILPLTEGAARSSPGLDGGQSARAAYWAVAKSIGMTRDTFRLTYQGSRWLTLPDVRSVLAAKASGLGVTFFDHLTDLLFDHGLALLRRDGKSRRPELVAEVRAMLAYEEVLSVRQVAELEKQARESVRLLADLQSQAQDHVGAFSSYWPYVSQAIEDPQLRWRSHVVRQLRACGYTVADVICEVLADTDGPVDTPRLAQLVHERAASVLGEHGLRPAAIYRKTLTNAVSHLLRRGEIVSGPDGYQAVPRPAPKRTGEERI